MEDFPLSAPSFEAVRRLLHKHTGIHLGPQKQAMVRVRLIKRLRAHGLQDFDAYLMLVKGPESPEWGAFVNALTTNLTSFFREKHHFEFLASHFAAHPVPGGRLQAWSAGCSTGEEPYTLAMVMAASFPEWDVRILATDVDTSVLETARRGVYPEERVEKLDREWKRFAFLKGTGAQAGQVRVRPELQAMVEFGIFNLLGTTGWPRPSSRDVIFCRNVMIYFDKPTQRELLRRFRAALVPGGLLLVGHSEALLDASLGFQSLGGTVYRKAEGP
ncbi:MAG: protein-glutamate O-methyltransferase CheR [Acidobacteria bacterium]|nr:protein-glutamate O-methyltransferase CheR [Acidobacteriota bacterium]